MKWNNGKAHKALEKECEKLRALGIPEEQVQAMYDYDLATLNGYRREAKHTQRLDFQAFDDDNELDDGQNPLLDKFADNLTVELDLSNASRYSWVQEIDDDDLASVLVKLSQSELELLTQMAFDGLTLTEIARKAGISQQAVSKRLQKIKNKFQKRL